MIYLDNSASTKPYKEVIDVLVQTMEENYANADAIHDFSHKILLKIKKARKIVADYLKVEADRIYFTAGGGDGNNLLLQGIINANSRIKKHLITTKIEHPSVYEVFRHYENAGFEVDYLDVDKDGYIDLKQLEDLIREDTILVSVGAVNSETGAIQDLDKISKIIRNKNKDTYFHTDFVQGFGCTNIKFDKIPVDAITVSGHKIHAQKGIGAIYVNKNINLRPFVLGGGQEKDFRSGTENVAGIMGLKVATKFMYENLEKRKKHLEHLRDLLIAGISKIEDHKFLTNKDGVPNIVTVAFENIRSEVLLHFLESEKIYISTGSACSKGKKSRTFDGIGLDNKYNDGVVRISLSEFNTEDEIAIFIENLEKYVNEIRTIMKRGR